MNALGGISNRGLRRALANFNTLKTNIQPRIVHHREHRAYPAHFGADQMPGTRVIIAKCQHARRRSMDTELMLNRNTAHIVAAAIGADFGHQKQRNPLRPRRCTGRAGENEMDDILRQIMLTKGDVNLGAFDQEATIALRRRGGAERADVRTRLRLSQVHRPRPFAGHKFGQIIVALFIAAMLGNRLNRADRQHRAERERHVRSAQILKHHRCECKGQSLPAERFRPVKRSPTTLYISLISLAESRRHRDRAVLPLRAVLITDPIEWAPFAVRETPRTLKDGINHIRRGSGEALSCGEFINPRHGFKNEALFGNRGGISHA